MAYAAAVLQRIPSRWVSWKYPTPVWVEASMTLVRDLVSLIQGAEAWIPHNHILVAFGVLPIRALLYTLTDNSTALVAIQILDGIGRGLTNRQIADEMFLAYTQPCLWDGAARDYVTTGYLVRDGEYVLLVDGNRRCEFDPDMGWMRKIWLDAVDEHGRELSAVGELVSHHGERGQGTGYFHWEWNGASGYGEDQSTVSGDLLRALNGAGLWT